jgi:DNA-binding MarR family transcriptional regulator
MRRINMATQAKQKPARGKSASPATSSLEFDFTRSPIHLLRRAQQRALEIFNHEVGASGLTPRQFVVLLAVQENEGLTQTDLVNRTRIDRSTLADMISRLIKREMLGRRRTERDQRANAVTITAGGRKALKTALARIARAEEKLLETVPETRRGAFLDNLGIIAQAGEPAPAAAKPAPAKRAAPAARTKAKAQTTAAKTTTAKTPAAKPAARRAPAARGRAKAATAAPAVAKAPKAVKAAKALKAPQAAATPKTAATPKIAAKPKAAAKPKKAPAAKAARKAKTRK